MKQTNVFFLTICALSIVMPMLSGCGKGSSASSGVYVRGGTEQRLRIAVMPFDDVSKNPDAGEIVTNTVLTYLLSTKSFDVVDPGVLNDALNAEGIRPGENMSSEAYQKLRARLKVDALVVGLVEDYGEVRVGEETYPSVSFSTRLIDTQSSEILWAASISKTGDEDVKIFDIGRVASISKLCEKAAASMADEMVAAKPMILAGITTPPAPAAPAATNAGSSAGTTETASAETTSTTATASTAANANPGAAPKYMNEVPTYGETEMSALLTDVGAIKVGTINYSKHFHDTIETQYNLADGKFIEVKLVDYQKAAITGKFLALDHIGEDQVQFDQLPAYADDSDQGYHHLDVSVGRFGLYVKGPKTNQTDIETLTKGIIDLLK
ncbi:MAG: GNA1162 family protein [Capsulimonadaceae bacterium]